MLLNNLYNEYLGKTADINFALPSNNKINDEYQKHLTVKPNEDYLYHIVYWLSGFVYYVIQVPPERLHNLAVIFF